MSDHPRSTDWPDEWDDWRDEYDAGETTLHFDAWMRAYHPEKVSTDG